jgi:hypothetical protein
MKIDVNIDIDMFHIIINFHRTQSQDKKKEVYKNKQNTLDINITRQYYNRNR